MLGITFHTTSGFLSFWKRTALHTNLCCGGGAKNGGKIDNNVGKNNKNIKNAIKNNSSTDNDNDNSEDDDDIERSDDDEEREENENENENDKKKINVK